MIKHQIRILKNERGTNMNIICEGKTFSQSYMDLVFTLMKQGVTKAPRGQKISHIQNCLFVVNEPGTVFSCDSRKYRTDYLNKELALYFSGDCSAEKFGEASVFWLQLKNPDNETINSNYGYRIFYKPIESKFVKHSMTQWDYCKQQLLNDKDTRQGLIFVSGDDVQFPENKDFICTLTYCFNIENDKLNLTVNRRSQDLFFGLPYDYVWEYALLLKMHNELKEKYPELQIGKYSMFCNNIHIYERNFETFKMMLADFSCGKYQDFDINELINDDNKAFIYDKTYGTGDFKHE